MGWSLLTEIKNRGIICHGVKTGINDGVFIFPLSFPQELTLPVEHMRHCADTRTRIRTRPHTGTDTDTRNRSRPTPANRQMHHKTPPTLPLPVPGRDRSAGGMFRRGSDQTRARNGSCRGARTQGRPDVAAQNLRFKRGGEWAGKRERGVDDCSRRRPTAPCQPQILLSLKQNRPRGRGPRPPRRRPPKTSIKPLIPDRK